jgi:anaerobic ribonucleoside-triphosphate reductase-activating protein
MRYSSMRNLDISNGEGVGVSLFVQGCPFHCKNCFNSDTWDFNGGKEWTEETKNKFIELINRPYIKRVSFLGGECLAEQNLDEVLKLVKQIRNSYPDKTIWLYTGYHVFINYPESHRQHKVILSTRPNASTNIIYDDELFFKKKEEDRKRSEIIFNIDVLVDGEYIDEQKDLSLKWRGSKNQRVIDVKQSLAQNKMVLYCD